MRAGLPAFSTASSFCSIACSAFTLPSLLALAARSTLVFRFSTVSRSASSSSVLMMSMSCSGLTPPATWITSGSSKHRTTWQIASVARICPRNWLPSPSPLLAPSTRPGDVDELHRRRHQRLRLDQRRDLRQPLVRHRHHAGVRVDRAERVVGSLRLRRGEGVEDRRFSDVGQANDSAIQGQCTVSFSDEDMTRLENLSSIG